MTALMVHLFWIIEDSAQACNIDEVPMFLIEVAEVLLSLAGGQGKDPIWRLLHIFPSLIFHGKELRKFLKCMTDYEDIC